MFKMFDLIDIKNFYSDKDLTRFTYLERSLLIVGIIIFANVLYTLKFSHRNTSTTLQWVFDFVVGGGLLIWTLTKHIVTHIKLDFKDKKFIVHYLTILSDDNKIEVPFEFLTFDFIKEPTRNRPKNRILIIYNRKKKVFTIETNEDGFSMETLEELVDDLKNLTNESQ